MSRISHTDIRRTRGGVPFSEAELDLTDRAAAGRHDQGRLLGRHPQAAAADLGIDPENLDEARSTAPRRRNHREPRQREEQGR